MNDFDKYKSFLNSVGVRENPQSPVVLHQWDIFSSPYLSPFGVQTQRPFVFP